MDISDKAVANFHGFVSDVRARGGETIYSADEPAKFVFCVRSGFVKLVEGSATCRSRIVRIVEPDGVIGLEALFSPRFGQKAVAMGDVVACRVPAKALRSAVAAVPSVQLRLLEQAQRALMEAGSWLCEFAGGNAPARERMAKLLLRLRDGRSRRAHRFSLEDISALLGIRRESASRILAAMGRNGLLEKCAPGPRSNYYLADFRGLERIAQGESP